MFGECMNALQPLWVNFRIYYVATDAAVLKSAEQYGCVVPRCGHMYVGLLIKSEVTMLSNRNFIKMVLTVGLSPRLRVAIYHALR